MNYINKCSKLFRLKRRRYTFLPLDIEFEVGSYTYRTFSGLECRYITERDAIMMSICEAYLKSELLREIYTYNN